MALADLPRGGGNVPWPPRDVQDSYVSYGENSAWYGGRPQDLTRFYAGYAGQDRTGFFDPVTTAQPFTAVWRRMFFWARQQPGQVTRARYHVPIAADISSTSADQLFSDEPRILIPEAHLKKASSKAKKIQDRLDEYVDEDGLIARFHEAAEISSALGGAFLCVTYDKDFADRAMIHLVHPDNAIPAFRWGVLSEVLFWRFVLTDGKDVWRHLEMHQPGKITHGLYKGTAQFLGAMQKLGALPQTSMFASEANEQQEISTGLPGLDCVYVPNMRPNRFPRGSDLGRSDYQGVESLMDALDETATSWMRDIRLGKARIFAPEEFVSSQGRGKGASFDLEREVYELLKMTPQGNQAVITPSQFAIRHDEHNRTMEMLIERIVATAGYSGSTFGLSGGAAALNVERTATEVAAREHRTIVTRGKKIRYWLPAISDILETLLRVDAAVFGGPGFLRPRADFPETVHDSLKDTANAIAFLDQARAISTQVKVEMAHPTWDPQEIQDEVDRLLVENAQRPVPGAATVGTSGGPAAATPGQSPEPGAAPPNPGLPPPGMAGNLVPPSTTPST